MKDSAGLHFELDRLRANIKRDEATLSRLIRDLKIIRDKNDRRHRRLREVYERLVREQTP